MRRALSLIISLIFFAVNAQPKRAQPKQVDLVRYLKSHWQSPERYVISKFRSHDIVFLGEYHRIKHDVELVHQLIPRLYKARVYNLGIEFGVYEHQDKVDRLITAKTYDENLARWLMFQHFSAWGYKEYEDIYRIAWQLNRSLPKSARKFRVVNLGYRAYWPARQEVMTPADWDKVWWKGDPDKHMADVIIKEFVDKRQKALIYSGNHHAFTRYHQPIYDYENKKLDGFNTTRMGNLVYKKIGDRAFNISLHRPWSSSTNYNADTRPVQGLIDSVMQQLGNRRVGFDVKGSPFGLITDTESYYSLGYANFTLDKYCDGYIFQKAFADYEGVTVDPLFVTDENFAEAMAYSPNPVFRKRAKTAAEVMAAISRAADIKTRFKHLR